MSHALQMVRPTRRAWGLFAYASALAAILMLLQFWILEGLWPSDGEDLPPILAIFQAAAGWAAGLPLGLVVAVFRRFVIGPKFPFLRWGYIAVAALELLQVRIWQRDWSPAFLIDGQISLLATMLIFAWLGRRSGVLDDPTPGGPVARPNVDAA